MLNLNITFCERERNDKEVIYDLVYGKEKYEIHMLYAPSNTLYYCEKDIPDELELFVDTIVRKELVRLDNQKELALEFVESIASFTPESLRNFQFYLSQHFDTWLEKYANTPENIVAEMKDFASIV